MSGDAQLMLMIAGVAPSGAGVRRGADASRAARCVPSLRRGRRRVGLRRRRGEPPTPAAPPTAVRAAGFRCRRGTRPRVRLRDHRRLRDLAPHPERRPAREPRARAGPAASGSTSRLATGWPARAQKRAGQVCVALDPAADRQQLDPQPARRRCRRGGRGRTGRSAASRRPATPRAPCPSVLPSEKPVDGSSLRTETRAGMLERRGVARDARAAASGRRAVPDAGRRSGGVAPGLGLDEVGDRRRARRRRR